MRGDETSPVRRLPAGHRSPIACEFFSPRTWAGWIPVTSTGMRGGCGATSTFTWGYARSLLTFRTAYGRCSEGRHSLLLIPVLVTGIQQRRVCGAEKPVRPRNWPCWLPVAGTGMTVGGRALRRQRGVRHRCGFKKRRLAGAVCANIACHMEKWWAMRDSNSRHPRCKRGALPTELIALSRCRTSVRRVGGRDLCVTGENRKSVRAIFSNFLSRAGAPVMKLVDK